MPNADELALIQNEQATAYVRKLHPKEAPPSSQAEAVERYARFYPQADPKLLSLLAQLLQFDPRKRPSAAEALEHPYLAAYREAPDEGLAIPEICMDFEEEAPTKERLRELIWDEVVRYHPGLATVPAGKGHTGGR